jgi:hypothetical protein
MNNMLVRSHAPALLVAPPAGQQRVSHRWMRSEPARAAFRRTKIHAEVFNNRGPGGSLSTGIGMRVRPDRPQSP